METVIRNVGDIDAQDRLALEHVLGQQLTEQQQVVIRVVSPQIGSVAPMESNRNQIGDAILPDWCNVYAGLSDEEIAELEKTILTRADFMRPVE